MNKLETLYPGLEEFIRDVLAKENLSFAAERKRLKFVELFDVPPLLPPRPDCLQKPCNATDSSSFIDIAKERQLSRQGPPAEDLQERESRADDSNTIKCSNGGSVTDAKSWAEKIFKKHDDDDDDDDIYEEPILDYRISDSSSISCEMDEHDKDNIPLPSKKKPIFTLPRLGKRVSFSMSGELWHKHKNKWTSQFAAVECSNLHLYKSEKDQKLPIRSYSLPDFEIFYMQHEYKRNHVLKLVHNSETHCFSADGKDKTLMWFQHLQPLCSSKHDILDSGVSISSPLPVKSISNSDLAAESGEIELGEDAVLCSSEGGSGDGIVKLCGDMQTTNRKSSLSNFGNSQILKFFLGEKKSEKIKKEILSTDFEEVMTKPDALVQGVVNVCCEEHTGNKFVPMWADVVGKTLSVYSELKLTKPDFTLDLSKCTEIDRIDEKKHDLAVKIKGKENSIIIEPLSVLEQGKWLRVLINHSAVGQNLCITEQECVYIDMDNEASDSGDKIPPPLPAAPPPVNRERRSSLDTEVQCSLGDAQCGVCTLGNPEDEQEYEDMESLEELNIRSADDNVKTSLYGNVSPSLAQVPMLMPRKTFGSKTKEAVNNMNISVPEYNSPKAVYSLDKVNVCKAPMSTLVENPDSLNQASSDENNIFYPKKDLTLDKVIENPLYDLPQAHAIVQRNDPPALPFWNSAVSNYSSTRYDVLTRRASDLTDEHGKKVDFSKMDAALSSQRDMTPSPLQSRSLMTHGVSTANAQPHKVAEEKKDQLGSLDQEVEKIRNEIADLKKTRKSVRTKKLASDDAEEKLALDKTISQLKSKIDEQEIELFKVEVKQLESGRKEASPNRSHSLNVSRTSSFSCETSGTIRSPLPISKVTESRETRLSPVTRRRLDQETELAIQKLRCSSPRLGATRSTKMQQRSVVSRLAAQNGDEISSRVNRPLEKPPSVSVGRTAMDRRRFLEEPPGTDGLPSQGKNVKQQLQLWEALNTTSTC